MDDEPFWDEDYDKSSTLFEYINTLSSKYIDSERFWDALIFYNECARYNQLYCSSHLQEMLNISECDDVELSTFLKNIQAINKKEKEYDDETWRDSKNYKFHIDCVLARGDDVYFLPKYLEDEFFNIVNYSIMDKTDSYAAFKYILQNKDYIDRFDVENYLFFAYLVRNFDAIHILEEKFPRECFNADYMRMIVLMAITQMIKLLTISHYVSTMRDVALSQVNDYYNEIMYIINHNNVFPESIYQRINIDCQELDFNYYVRFITSLFDDFEHLFDEPKDYGYRSHSISDTNSPFYSSDHYYSQDMCVNISILLFPFIIISEDTFALYDAFAYRFHKKFGDVLLEPMEILSARITRTSIHPIIPALVESKVLEYMLDEEEHCSKCDYLLAALCHDYVVLKFPIHRLKQLLKIRIKRHYKTHYYDGRLGQYNWDGFRALLNEIILNNIDLPDEDNSVKIDKRSRMFGKRVVVSSIRHINQYTNNFYMNQIMKYIWIPAEWEREEKEREEERKKRTGNGYWGDDW